MNRDVAFIVVNYNTCGLTEAIIQFFRTVDLPFSHGLVVVDNASTDGSQAMLEQAQGDQVLYIQTHQNLGYGRGMNRGLEAVSSRYACIMNTDLILNREALVALWEFFEGNPEAGVATPVIRWKDGRMQGFLTLPGLCFEYLQTLGGINARRWKKKVKTATGPLRVPGTQGAFFMIRRAMFPERLFDEDFFFYYEDTELAHRYWRQGIPCFALPSVSIIHLGGQSTSAEGGKLFQASRRLYIDKCYGPPHTTWLAGIDRIRIRYKHYKYAFLNSIIKSEKIRAKYEYYGRLARPQDRIES
ncbi:glycosyltransferase [Holophaga foetida]|uniref:glycosyltransferase n=1 Tax=Holophaga foetida TaxID=35839 RepID=UPI0002473B44|nr:glycosyltransferase family 2 protein [Holophaga foetida]